jgi:hypothetical protein
MLLFLFGLISFDFAQVETIEVDKMKDMDGAVMDVLASLKVNQSYCDHWSPQWNYSISKDDLIHELRKNYSILMGYNSQSVDLQLMMGMTAHYLYNLDDTLYYNVAIRHFKEAIQNESDGRGQWMLGRHYALSGNIQEGFVMMDRAMNLLSEKNKTEFWNDYAMVSAMANMPVHAMMGMDQYREKVGKTSYFESQLGNTMKERILKMDPDSNFLKEQIWFLKQSSNIDEYICNPLGIKFYVDSTNEVIVYDYQRNQNAVLIKPPAIQGKMGISVGMSVLMLMHPAKKDGQSLDDYMSLILKDFKNKSPTLLETKYGKLKAFEIKDPSLYPEMGGGHMWLVGLEREEPRYPGLIFEYPTQPNQEKNEQGMNYYHPSETIGRFPGKIQYLFLLDTCEEIYEPSMEFFIRFLNERLILE